MPKILTVDDSAMLREMVLSALSEVGYSDVEQAVDGESGFAKAQATQYDLIISDVNMPGMSGFQMVEKIRTLPNYAKTPILMLTTESSDDMKQKGKACGATGWIVKPFTPDKLLKIVNKVLGA